LIYQLIYIGIIGGSFSVARKTTKPRYLVKDYAAIAIS